MEISSLWKNYYIKYCSFSGRNGLLWKCLKIAFPALSNVHIRAPPRGFANLPSLCRPVWTHGRVQPAPAVSWSRPSTAHGQSARSDSRRDCKESRPRRAGRLPEGNTGKHILIYSLIFNIQSFWLLPVDIHPCNMLYNIIDPPYNEDVSQKYQYLMTASHVQWFVSQLKAPSDIMSVYGAGLI